MKILILRRFPLCSLGEVDTPEITILYSIVEESNARNSETSFFCN